MARDPGDDARRWDAAWSDSTFDDEVATLSYDWCSRHRSSSHITSRGVRRFWRPAVVPAASSTTWAKTAISPWASIAASRPCWKPRRICHRAAWSSAT